MPLLKYSDPLPEWSELDFIEILKIGKGDEKSFDRRSLKEKFFIGEGACIVTLNGANSDMKREDFIETVSPGNPIKIKADQDSIIIRVGGRWSNETGSCGVFVMNNSPNPKNIGDPVDYDRSTDFDNHFHDCDEYWIIYKGSGLAVSEGKRFKLMPGTILATKTGDHHDLPEVYEEIDGVWLETSLKGNKRKGHLWKHMHGD